jgi:hypothetical protein
MDTVKCDPGGENEHYAECKDQLVANRHPEDLSSSCCLFTRTRDKAAFTCGNGLVSL